MDSKQQKTSVEKYRGGYTKEERKIIENMYNEYEKYYKKEKENGI